jgi:hypothetical protein
VATVRTGVPSAQTSGSGKVKGGTLVSSVIAGFGAAASS